MNLTDQRPTTLPARLPVKPETEIIAGWHTSASAPTVSICCATYNHEAYIEDAICGFLAQETNFPFEIIIRDDASEDGTTSIVKQYEARYPNIVKAVINPENEFRKGIRPSQIWPKLASGKYLAICEGDDFWTSPHKLQKQVELLERHPEAVLSVALTDFFRQENGVVECVRTTTASSSELIYFEELQGLYFHTSTYVIRAELYASIAKKYLSGRTPFGDTALRAILISCGPFAVLPEVVSVYRITGTGIWSALSQEKKLAWEFQVTRELAPMLFGHHRQAQRVKLYSLSRALFSLAVRTGKLRGSAKWGARTFRYGVEEAGRRMARLGRRLFHTN